MGIPKFRHVRNVLIGLGVLLLFAPSRPASASWQLYPCGRGVCGNVTPLPTPTNTQTPDPNSTALPTATPWPTPLPTATPFPNAFQLHLDVAAAQGHTDGNGVQWSADQAYTPGSYGFLDNGNAYLASGPVDLTDDAPLYLSFRQASGGQMPTLHYQVDVAPGNYLVTLYFSEFIATAPGQRVLGVTLQNSDQSPNLDLYALDQAGRAVTATYPVTVSSGSLDIKVRGVTGAAVLSALSVQGLQSAGSPSPSPSPTPSSSPTATPTPSPGPPGGGITIQILQPAGVQLLP
jgi:hypothetical protein